MNKKLLIAGGGPGGISAAIAAAKNGCSVTLVDENPAFGGQIWRQGVKKRNKQSVKWLDELERLPIEMINSTTVFEKTGSRVSCFHEQLGVRSFETDALILANGARELFLPFPGWTLPNVMGCGGAQAMMKGGMSVAGKKVVVAGSGPLLLAVAWSFAQAGAELKAIVEQVPGGKLNKFAMSLLSQPSKLLQGIKYRLGTLKAPFITGSWISEAHGSSELEAVSVSGAKEQKFDCDILACGFGLVPNSEFAVLQGCDTKEDFVVVDDNQCSSVEDVWCIGELTGIGGVDKALLEGEIAGLAVSGEKTDHLQSKRAKCSKFTQKLAEVYALNPSIKKLSHDDTLVCRCEDVSYGELKEHKSQRSAKLYTRCGMGACQGRICSAACGELFSWQRNKVSTPLIPLPLSAFTEDI
jgi:NADPH-dependent 2,4-dienoyl-CoA reductase/sulfur reductase-like enzyme